MNQDEINKREHEDPANWSSPLAFYRSSLDSRLWVPKKPSWMGWTLNLAHPVAGTLVLVFFLALCLVVAAVVYAMLPR